MFAVRQGPPLADNLRRVLLGQAPQPFTPQSRYLSILGTGDGNAVATRGGWAIEGAWVWRWKDHIDRKWMRMYREPPAEPMDEARAPRRPIRRWPTPRPSACWPTSACAAAAAAPRSARVCSTACWPALAPRPFPASRSASMRPTMRR